MSCLLSCLMKRHKNRVLLAQTSHPKPTKFQETASASPPAAGAAILRSFRESAEQEEREYMFHPLVN